LSTPTQAPELSQEQLDRLADRLRGPVTRRILNNAWTWAGFFSLLLALLGASYVTIRAKVEEIVTSQIAQRFAQRNIRETFQDVAKKQAREMLRNEIQPEVTRFRDETTTQVQNFQVFLDNMKADFQREYLTLAEEVSRLKQRNYLTALGDKAISEGEREALNELARVAEMENAEFLKAASIAEIRRVLSFWTLMATTSKTSISFQLEDGSVQEDDHISTNILVTKCLYDLDFQVRAVSARSLGQRKEKGVPDALLKVASIDKHLEVVKHAIQSFNSITGSQVSGILDIEGYEKWWKEHSAEVNERLADMK